MRVLVTGGAGYLGSVLIPKLLARGHSVRVLDLGYFGVGHLRSYRPQVELVRQDLRRIAADARLRDEVLDAVDCIIHLAAISNDPSAELNPSLTHEVNFWATAALAEAASTRRIHFVFSSSCSVYGDAACEMDEHSAVRPLTAYAVSKVEAEKALIELADRNWSPVILRNGTLYGYSPRMRFDLVANIFALYSTLHNEIRIFGDGLQWRPFLHVNDCARAFVHFAEAEDNAFTVYNVATENLRVVDVAAIFGRLNPRLRVAHLEVAEPDKRDYRVSTGRLTDAGFRPRIEMDEGAEDLIDAIVSGMVSDPESIYYQNAKWLKELSQIGANDHSEAIRLVEALAQVRPASRV